nr:unnamed protein product [Callosobruchus chinensis]
MHAFQSEIFFAKLFAVPWCTWNYNNRQMLLILLPNLMKPEVIGFGEIAHLNYQLIKTGLRLGVWGGWGGGKSKPFWLENAREVLSKTSIPHFL